MQEEIENPITDAEKENPEENGGMEEALEEAFKHPILKMLLSNPTLIGLLNDLNSGKEMDAAMNDNMKGWRKRKQVTELPMEIEDSEIRDQVLRLCQTSESGELSEELIGTLKKGVEYESAVQAAREEGYLKGKNEKIELMRTPHIAKTETAQTSTKETAQFPSYRRKSLWDI